MLWPGLEVYILPWPDLGAQNARDRAQRLEGRSVLCCSLSGLHADHIGVLAVCTCSPNLSSVAFCLLILNSPGLSLVNLCSIYQTQSSCLQNLHVIIYLSKTAVSQISTATKAGLKLKPGVRNPIQVFDLDVRDP